MLDKKHMIQRPKQSPTNGERASVLRLTLISPKGPLYRHRGGIFGKSLRYMPLTLPTLAALVPQEITAEISCVDEGITEVDVHLQADLVGLTVITGTAPRAYELARHFRSRGIAVVLGGPHVTLVPEEAQAHGDAIVVGYAEETWPQLLRDFCRGDVASPLHSVTRLSAAWQPAARPVSAARAPVSDRQRVRGDARLCP